MKNPDWQHCRFLWYKYFHHNRFPAERDVAECGGGKRRVPLAVTGRGPAHRTSSPLGPSVEGARGRSPLSHLPSSHRQASHKLSPNRPEGKDSPGRCRQSAPGSKVGGESGGRAPAVRGQWAQLTGAALGLRDVSYRQSVQGHCDGTRETRLRVTEG